MTQGKWGPIAYPCLSSLHNQPSYTATFHHPTTNFHQLLDYLSSLQNQLPTTTIYLYRRNTSVLATQTHVQNRPEEDNRFPSTFFVSPMRTSTRSERLERRRRRALEMHLYTDEELRNILIMMSQRQDEDGLLSSDPTFVRKYISPGLVPPEDEASLLRRQVDTNLIRRLNVQPGTRTFAREESGGVICGPVMQFTWFGVKPVLPRALEDLPIINLHELISDPRNIRLDISHPFDVSRNQEAVRADDDVFGTLGLILTAETDTKCRHVATTVGHVLGNKARRAFMKTKTDENSF